MANRIKGITVEIGGDTTKLSKALEGVNRDIKGTQTQLKDVQKLLKLDPSNTELLSQKHKLLADAVTATKEKLEVLKTAAEQANTALANGEISQQQYDALQREIIETENELKRLTTEANNSHTALEKMGVLGETLQSAGDKISGVGQKLLPVTAGVTALGTIAVKLVRILILPCQRWQLFRGRPVQRWMLSGKKPVKWAAKQNFQRVKLRKP